MNSNVKLCFALMCIVLVSADSDPNKDESALSRVWKYLGLGRKGEAMPEQQNYYPQMYTQYGPCALPPTTTTTTTPAPNIPLCPYPFVPQPLPLGGESPGFPVPGPLPNQFPNGPHGQGINPMFPNPFQPQPPISDLSGGPYSPRPNPNLPIQTQGVQPRPFNPNSPYGPNPPFNPNAPFNPNGPFNPNAPFNPNGPVNPNLPFNPNENPFFPQKPRPLPSTPVDVNPETPGILSPQIVAPNPNGIVVIDTPVLPGRPETPLIVDPVPDNPEHPVAIKPSQPDVERPVEVKPIDQQPDKPIAVKPIEENPEQPEKIPPISPEVPVAVRPGQDTADEPVLVNPGPVAISPQPLVPDGVVLGVLPHPGFPIPTNNDLIGSPYGPPYGNQLGPDGSRPFGPYGPVVPNGGQPFGPNNGRPINNGPVSPLDGGGPNGPNVWNPFIPNQPFRPDGDNQIFPDRPLGPIDDLGQNNGRPFDNTIGPKPFNPNGPNGGFPNGPNGGLPFGPNGVNPNKPNGGLPLGPNAGLPYGPNGEGPNGGRPFGPNGGRPLVPNGEGPNGGRPLKPNGEGPNAGRPFGPNGEGPNGGRPFRPNGEGPNGGRPFGPNGEGPSGGRPFGPNGEGPNGGRPFGPNGEGPNGGRPFGPNGEGPNGRPFGPNGEGPNGGRPVVLNGDKPNGGRPFGPNGEGPSGEGPNGGRPFGPNGEVPNSGRPFGPNVAHPLGPVGVLPLGPNGALPLPTNGGRPNGPEGGLPNGGFPLSTNGLVPAGGDSRPPRPNGIIGNPSGIIPIPHGSHGNSLPVEPRPNAVLRPVQGIPVFEQCFPSTYVPPGFYITKSPQGTCGAEPVGPPPCSMLEMLQRLRLRTFSTLIRLAGLEELFIDNTGYTLFVPVDASFEGLPRWFLESLIADKPLLRNFLLAHFIQADVPLDTLGNEYLLLNKRPGSHRLRVTIAFPDLDYPIYMIDAARILKGDILTTNGRLNILDKVLKPNPPRNAAQYLREVDAVKHFVEALELAGMIPLLEGSDPITLFIPHNHGFNRSELSLLSSDQKAIQNFCKYHMVNGSYYSAGLQNGQYLTTNYLKEIKIGVASDGFTKYMTLINGYIKVLKSDITTTNAVIHIIDEEISSAAPFYTLEGTNEFGFEFEVLKRNMNLSPEESKDEASST